LIGEGQQLLKSEFRGKLPVSNGLVPCRVTAIFDGIQGKTDD
jgi:hypothetical protein